MDILKQYNSWLDSSYFDEDTKKELHTIKDDIKEIEDRFYRELEFGTAGLRGVIGAGTNRMNIYTVRKASQGLANYILKQGKDAKERGVVIAYDSRHKSPEFSLEAAKVFAGNGIKAYLFDELKPTPELSFAVRHLNAIAGIVVTASHNPKQYNGYKVYGEDGGQLPLDASNMVLAEIDNISNMNQTVFCEKEEAIAKGLLKIIGIEIDDIYIEKLKTLSLNAEVIKEVSDTFKIIYTPLHGTGNKPVRRILKEIGFKNVLIVKEQEEPDPDFSTIKYPNPEDKEAFQLAIKLAKEENIDLIIGSDPDCDRVGVVVRNADNDYIVLSGNQTGCLLLEYLLSQMSSKGILPKNGFVVKTIVTTELARKIAENYNIELVEVLTGFKFIGEKIKLLDEQGDKKYIFGFEESFGYLAGTFARDKDGVVTSMLIAEMAAFYRSQNMSLYEGLMEIYKKYGYTMESVSSFTLEGKEGIEKIKEAMKTLGKLKSENFGAVKLKAFRNYNTSERYCYVSDTAEEILLPKSDVLYYEVEDGSWFCIRPSGTEPKIKVYYGVSEKDFETTKNKLENLKNSVLLQLNPLLNQ